MAKKDATMLGFNKEGMEKGSQNLIPGFLMVLGFSLTILGFITMLFSFIWGLVMVILGGFLSVKMLYKIKK